MVTVIQEFLQINVIYVATVFENLQKLVMMAIKETAEDVH